MNVTRIETFFHAQIKFNVLLNLGYTPKIVIVLVCAIMQFFETT